MNRVRLAWILPVLQLCVATGLLIWGSTVPRPRVDTLWVPTATMICYGINAPAILFRVFVFPFYLAQYDLPRLFGLGLDRFLFLVEVVIVWFLVGRGLGNLRLRGGRVTLPTLGNLLHNLLLIALGVLLFLLGLVPVRGMNFNNPAGALAEGSLFILWSLCLVVTAMVRITTVVGRWKT
jgi:hypothetical protein